MVISKNLKFKCPKCGALIDSLEYYEPRWIFDERYCAGCGKGPLFNYVRCSLCDCVLCDACDHSSRREQNNGEPLCTVCWAEGWKNGRYVNPKNMTTLGGRNT